MGCEVEDVPAGVWCWHIHHDTLVELSTEPLANRVEFIKGYKLEEEVAVRLERMRPVKGTLPKAVVEAQEAYGKAREAYDKAQEVYGKAWEAYGKAQEALGEAQEALGEAREALGEAWKAYDKAQEAYAEALRTNLVAVEGLHSKECPDCPWNGRTLFPEREW